MNKIIFLFMPLLLCQCASIEKSVGLGAGIGGATGVVAAQMPDYNAKGNVVLALSGAVIGGVVGALLHKENPQSEVLSSPPPAPLDLGSGTPPLKSAEKDILWVPDKISGDKFEEGHRVFIIKNPAHWQLRDKPETESEDDNEDSE